MTLPWTNKKYSNDISKLEKEFSPNLCRVCMSDTKLKCIFSTETLRTIEQFKFCTGLQITKEDGLPTKLCDLCYRTLDIAQKFKAACLRSDVLFRNIIRKQKLSVPEVKIEIKEDFEVPVGDLEYQDLETKQELDSDDDDYLLCNVNTGPTAGTRVKVKCETNGDKNTTSRRVNKVSQDKTYDVKSEKRDKNSEHLEPKEEPITWNCSSCDIKFNSRKEQLKHIRDQHGDTTYICEVCGMTFKHRTTHYSHVRSHRPPAYHCDQCDYSTCFRADMNKHVRIHKGVREYACKYCSQSFVTASNRADHVRRHHAAKKHICPRCGRAFAEASKLRPHLDSHDNIKRFECKVCHSRFMRRRQWKIHLMKVHNISVPRVRPGRSKDNRTETD